MRSLYLNWCISHKDAREKIEVLLRRTRRRAEYFQRRRKWNEGKKNKYTLYKQLYYKHSACTALIYLPTYIYIKNAENNNILSSLPF